MKPVMPPAGWSEFVQESCDDPQYPAPLDLHAHVLTAKRRGMYDCSVVSDRSVSSDEHETSSSDDTDSELTVFV